MTKSLRYIVIAALLVFGSVLSSDSENSAKSDESKTDGGSAKISPAPPYDETKRNTKHKKHTNRIVGGQVSKGRPFIAALLYEQSGQLFQYCGASVIGNRWLVTAAHCDVQSGEHAIIGRADLSKVGGVQLKVVNVYNHPSYNAQTHDNDIAIVRLSGDIPTAIPRVNIEQVPTDGTRIVVAGYGLTTEGGSQSLQLREVEVPIVRHDLCKTKYLSLTANMICAGEAGKDSCQGDSGSALFSEQSNKRISQYGVVSFGVGCGREGWPGVYSKPIQYSAWIADQMKK